METQAERPVVDATGLKGKYDIKLTWSPGNGDSDNGPTLLSALESQLGLRLERKQAQLEVLVVDHAERFPAEN